MSTLIIGAGASGLALAVQLKKLNINENVVILERLNTAGKKILATGNGRCNLTNENAPNCSEVKAFFNSMGLITYTDGDGRVYPHSMKASDVRRLLAEQCNKAGVTVIPDESAADIEKKDGVFIVRTKSGGIYKADYAAVCTGGQSQPKLGSNGSGYKLLTHFGHTLTDLSPALVQLTSSYKHKRRLSGMRIKCKMTIELDGKPASSEYGEVLFTDYGLSGIVTMNLSGIVSRRFQDSNVHECTAVLDLAPDMSADEIAGHINKFGSVSGILGYELNDILIKQSGNSPSRTAALVKGWRLAITGTKGFEYSQITNGGIRHEEFNNFESKKANGLFACGEILDIQHPCGGYNLDFAFHSGIEAAKQIANKIKGKDN